MSLRWPGSREFCRSSLHQVTFDRLAFLNNTTKSLRIEQAAETLFACLVASRENGRDQRSSIAYRTSVSKSEKKACSP